MEMVIVNTGCDRNLLLAHVTAYVEKLTPYGYDGSSEGDVFVSFQCVMSEYSKELISMTPCGPKDLSNMKTYSSLREDVYGNF